MSKFTRSFTRYLEQSEHSASQLERAAHIGNGWVTKLKNGAEPTKEKVESLLAVLPDDVARALLRDFLLDCTPENWLHRVSIAVSESPRKDAAEGVTFDPAKPDSFDRAIETLSRMGDNQKVQRHVFSLLELLSGKAKD